MNLKVKNLINFKLTSFLNLYCWFEIGNTFAQLANSLGLNLLDLEFAFGVRGWKNYPS